jgi:Collagen triple helix repeat (20 copies)
LRINPRRNYQMATCDSLEVDLSPPPPINITLEQYPCIGVGILQPNITIEAVTVANQGPKGDQGPIGPTGPAGPVGPSGPIGPTGAQGVQGPAGQKGDLGPQGATGPQGAQGVAGPQGAQGPTGSIGPTGTAATIAVGSTSTGTAGTNANVTNSGSSSAAVFNFTIPQGIKGDIGPQGPPGPAGSGTGDMLRSVYDVNGDNIVDHAALADTAPWTGISGKPATFPSDWNTTSNKPSTFTPNAHANTHLAAGSDPIAIATSVLAGLCPAVDNTTIQVVANKLSAVALAWTAITGKPSTFPPDSTAMLKSVYDTNADNIVDHAALADATPWTGITGKPATFPPDATAELVARKGTANGYPSLDATTKVPLVQLPAPASGDATAAQIVKGDDSRLTNARTPTAHASTHVTGGSDVIVPASVTTAGLLKQLSGNTTDFVDGANACQNLVTAVQPTIWSVRLRSFNAVGNPTFEVDQRNVGAAVINPSVAFSIDRWQVLRSGTPMTVNTQQASLGTGVGGGILLPGTSFVISQYCLRITLSAQQTTLAAGDYLILQQHVEGNYWRELMGDVHSLQILVRSSVAGLRFGMALNDGGTSLRSLTKLSPAGLAANTWTLIPFPNLPVWPSGGNFTSAIGVESYILRIVLACGSNNMSPANDTWQNVNAFGAVGQSNFAASPVNSTFDIAFVQHEPGAVCTTPMDCPFTQNLTGCQRYFSKSYGYATAPATVTNQNEVFSYSNSAGLATGHVKFPTPMAKVPTVTIYNSQTGAANSCQEFPSATNRTVTSSSIGDSAISYVAATSLASGQMVRFHYTADTGW